MGLWVRSRLSKSTAAGRGRQPLRVVLHLLKVRTMFRNLLQSGFATIVVSILGACATAPGGPASYSIDPPQGARVMTLVAYGVQTYSCEFDAQHHLGWVFRSPQATLFD